MSIKVPINILRKIIADILIKRGNTILDDADKIEEKEIVLQKCKEWLKNQNVSP